MSSSASLNFAFLAIHDPQLAKAAADAERLFAEHPPACLMLLRVFGELLAKRVAASAGAARESTRTHQAHRPNRGHPREHTSTPDQARIASANEASVGEGAWPRPRIGAPAWRNEQK